MVNKEAGGVQQQSNLEQFSLDHNQGGQGRFVLPINEGIMMVARIKGGHVAFFQIKSSSSQVAESKNWSSEASSQVGGSKFGQVKSQGQNIFK